MVEDRLDWTMELFVIVGTRTIFEIGKYMISYEGLTQTQTLDMRLTHRHR